MELEISYKHATTEAEKNPGLLLLAFKLMTLSVYAGLRDFQFRK